MRRPQREGRIRLAKECLAWVGDALRAPGIALVPLTPEIAVESSRLPGSFHGDPADRILVATARREGAILVTRDEGILAYGKAKRVAVMTV
jgi:PIN domain nuclease of toxin-antitoxin system